MFRAREGPYPIMRARGVEVARWHNGVDKSPTWKVQIMAYNEFDLQPETLEAATLRSVKAAGSSAAEASLDEAVVETARRYARAIDLSESVDTKCRECGSVAVPDHTAKTKALYLGPHLVNALRELGLTPAARNQAKGGEQVDPSDQAFNELKKRREARKAGQ